MSSGVVKSIVKLQRNKFINVKVFRENNEKKLEYRRLIVNAP